MATKYKDPLEKPLEPDRVNYANGILLDEQDFNAEQAYFRGRLSRALAYLHGLGTIAGLAVSVIEKKIPNSPNTDKYVLKISPGLAIDRLGRMIELPASYCIRVQPWFNTQDKARLQESFDNSTSDGDPVKAVVADVYIGFQNCERGMTPAFGVGNVDATDAFSAHRLRDSSKLSLILRTEINKDGVTQKSIADELDGRYENADDLAKRTESLYDYKLNHAWRESSFWDANNNKIVMGPEYLPGQECTEILLARVRIPATDNPIEFNDQQDMQEPDNNIRVLSFATQELYWLLKAT